ncbi:MAG: ABC transporter permease [Chloroflexota bacterium]|nr:ABC transporter permease [Chloroflexota bacterium]MDQ6906076.1 ABC transporter permease [Chloroflexota bacterium]
MHEARAATASSLAQVEPKASIRGEGYLQGAWRRLRRDRFAMAALILFACICLISLAAPFISAHLIHADPNRGRLTQKFQSPSGAHWLGTDDFGRDVAARLVHAGRVSLSIGFGATGIALAIGVSVGLLAAYYGRWVDDTSNAVIQVLNNIPGLFLFIMISVLFRPGVGGLTVIFGILGWTGIARLVRFRVLTERRREYVDAATAIGVHPLRIMFRHILPNISSIILVLAGTEIFGVILAEAGISYLGFGVQIPTASWGNMLSKSFDYFNQAPWLVVAPGVMVVLTVTCLYQLTDGLRDALDPRLKS